MTAHTIKWKMFMHLAMDNAHEMQCRATYRKVPIAWLQITPKRRGQFKKPKNYFIDERKDPATRPEYSTQKELVDAIDAELGDRNELQ
jgi:hypothetical protein